MIEGTSAFTSRFTGMSNRLTNDVKIFVEGDEMSVLALWDTGATNSCISEEVVQKLGLIPTGKVNMQTPSGVAEHNTYLVDIKLPNNVSVKDLQVLDSKIDSQGIGMLVGMDIISKGDLTVSNFNGKTVFTLEFLLNECTDYAKEINISNLIGPTHGKGKRKRKK